MGNRKKLEKAAKKAYKRADKAVDEAIRTAEKADRAAQKRARKLAERLADAAPDVSEAAGKPASGASIDLTPPLPTAGVEDPDAERTPGTPPHDTELDHLTVQALRDVARSRDLRNVAHLTKAQLIERLSE